MPEIRISLLKRSNLEVAPEAVWFEASVEAAGIAQSLEPGTYDESFHRCLYVWDFGDPGAASDKVVNLPAVHNDLNRGHGKFAAHVFTRPGSYRVTCTVHGPEGPIGSDAIEVTIGDPETLFARDRTIVVDPEGRGDPGHPQARLVADWEEAGAALEALDGPGRILLPRGATLEVADRTVTNRVANLYLGAWGDGAGPLLRTMSRTAPCLKLHRSFAGDAVLTGGLRLLGDWDSTTEEGEYGQSVGLRVPAQQDALSVLLDDVTISGFGQAVTTIREFDETGPKTVSVVLHNCGITNWGSYGAFIGGNREGMFAAIGCAIAQDPEAMQGGGGGRHYDSNQHGPIRVTHHARVFIDACDLFSRCSWTQIGNSGLPGQQPCLRLATSPRDGTLRAVVTRNAMEGGTTVLNVNRHGPDVTPHPMNVLIDKNYVVGTAYSERLIVSDYAGITIRNSICVKPDMPYPVGHWREAILCNRVNEHPDHSAPEHGGFRVEVYSNTVACLLSEAHLGDHPLALTSNLDEWQLFSDENNVLFAPNAPGRMREDPRLSLAPIATVGGTWQPRFRGMKFNFYDGLFGAQTRMDTAWATPADSAAECRPEPGSPLSGSAGGTHALDDFFGRMRADPAGRGAVE